MPHTNRERRAEDYRQARRKKNDQAFPPQHQQQGEEGERRRRRPPGPKSAPKPKKASVKNQMRSLQRALSRADANDEKRAAMEAKLKALEDERCSHQQKAKEQALAIRYHKVKFFERQKAVKALSRIERDLACATGEETDKLQASLQRAREDLLYIKFFPKNEKYIALFGSRSGGEDASPDVLERQRKCRMRALADAAAASNGDLAVAAESVKFHAKPQLNVQHVKQRNMLEDPSEDEDGDEDDWAGREGLEGHTGNGALNIGRKADDESNHRRGGSSGDEVVRDEDASGSGSEESESTDEDDGDIRLPVPKSSANPQSKTENSAAAKEVQKKTGESWADPDDFFLEEKIPGSEGGEEDVDVSASGGRSEGRAPQRGRGGRGRGRGISHSEGDRRHFGAGERGGRGGRGGASRGRGCGRTNSADRGRGRGRGRAGAGRGRGERSESSGFVGSIGAAAPNKRIKFSNDD